MAKTSELFCGIEELSETAILLGARPCVNEDGGVMFCFPFRGDTPKNMSAEQQVKIQIMGGFSVGSDLTEKEIGLLYDDMKGRTAAFIGSGRYGVSGVGIAGKIGKSQRNRKGIEKAPEFDLAELAYRFVSEMPAKQREKHMELVQQCYNELDALIAEGFIADEYLKESMKNVTDNLIAKVAEEQR